MFAHWLLFRHGDVLSLLSVQYAARQSGWGRGEVEGNAFIASHMGFLVSPSFFLQTAAHVTTLLQIYSDLCAHQNLQKRPIQLKFKMSQHHSEKTSVDQTDSREQRKNFAWWWIWDAFIMWVFYPILCLFVAITSRRFSSVFELF